MKNSIILLTLLASTIGLLAQDPNSTNNYGYPTPVFQFAVYFHTNRPSGVYPLWIKQGFLP